MKYLSAYFITIAALVLVAVPQAKSGTIYFPDEHAGNVIPHTGNGWVQIGNEFWTTQPGYQWNIPGPPISGPQQPNSNYWGSGRNQNGNPNAGGQCVPTTLPPEPQSGCCGRQPSNDDSMTVNNNNYDPSGRTYGGLVQQPPRFIPPWSFNDKKDAADENDMGLSLDTRISGGDETGFTQYPWTVHLEATFGYQYKPDATFNCGGALISARYVLSAAHCVTQPGAVLKSLTVYLAEYDTSTFPHDCKITVNGRECIENIRINAEKIVIHHGYESRFLSNDISLIRLNGTAPYTQYIRPICLPTIDIESPNLRNPQFAVAGWGLIGPQRTSIKQATLLNLVNRQVCHRSYPYLVQGHICATGRNGADTCQGDSGGPLMILYNGRYYVSGLVSGKRGDVNCGNNNVPSLYTNVYYYLNWIVTNLEN